MRRGLAVLHNVEAWLVAAAHLEEGSGSDEPYFFIGVHSI
jgi:hypothetical protein